MSCGSKEVRRLPSRALGGGRYPGAPLRRLLQLTFQFSLPSLAGSYLGSIDAEAFFDVPSTQLFAGYTGDFGLQCTCKIRN